MLLSIFFATVSSSSVIINFASLNIFHLVTDKSKYFCEIGDRMSVRQVAAVGEVHSKYGVTRLEKREVKAYVRICSRMWLDVHEFTIEELFCPVARDIFYDVGIDLSDVITFTRISFGVFIREVRGICLTHGT